MKTEDQIRNELNLGEDSSRQYKEKLNNTVQIANEMCAMSNSSGGSIYIGVNDNNTITGLTSDEINLYNQYVSNAASEHIRPAIYPKTQIIKIDGKLILVIEISDGTNKPYCTNEGIYWVKSGSDKRKASPQELMRLFQQSGQMYMDETPTSAMIGDVEVNKFNTFFEKVNGQEFSTTGLKLDQILVNMNLANNGKLNLGGLLLFGNNVQVYKPYCLIRAINYSGNEISDNNFIDKRDCIGTLDEQFKSAYIFLQNNLAHIQNEESFNSTGVLEIDRKALEEALVNALLHRDYSKNAVIRLLIFKNRVEIISPGSLPNHLSIENIKNGNSVIRNPLLCSFGTKILPYSGIGSGIPRIVKSHPANELINDKDGEQFTILLKRPEK